MKKYLTHAVIAKINATDQTKAPEWVLLFAAGWGELSEKDGRFFVDRQAFELVRAGIEKRGNEIVWDYEHQTLTQAKAPAAGWIKELRWTDGVGIEARVEWTEEAAEYIAKKEYRYFSPVFMVNKKDKRVSGLHSVALTNSPKTNNLTPLLAKLGAEHQPTPEDDMEFLKQLIAKLGLADDATEDQVLAVVDGLNEKSKTVAAKEVIPPDVITALGLKDSDDASVVVASIHALKQTEKGMVAKADFDALKATLATRDANEAVAGALKAGKITPDQKDWATEYAKRDLTGFNTFVAKAPVVIPTDKLPDGDRIIAKQQVDSETVKVASMFGNTAEDIKKYGQEAA